ncbi:hypothetical protein BD413DRAFT_174849 [Trametes elegans]|nr:hypothetical protein BD413DRAFT_174849 [Trametes elegans]
MVDVHRALQNDQIMPDVYAGPTLVHTTGPSHREWTDVCGGPAYSQSMTKERGGPAEPSLYDNTTSTQSASTMAHASSTDYMGLPRPQDSDRRVQARPVHGMPQRPPQGSHKHPSDAAKMPSREVCRKYIAGHCAWGHKCHRSHDVDPGRHTTQAVQFSSNVRVVDGVYTDRLSNTHRTRVEESITLTSAESSHSTPVEGAILRNGNPYLVPPIPPPPQSSDAVSRDLSTKDVIGRPEILDAERLQRAAEEDPRPCRRTDEVCRLFQKGLCHDQCPRTHIFLIPQACITQLIPSKPKPAPSRKIPATINYVAPDGTISEREVCKLGAVGQCARGDRCRFAHIDVSYFEVDEPASTSAVGDSGDSVTDIPGASGHRSAATPQARLDVVPAQENVHLTPSPGKQRENTKPREVCRLYFRGLRCYKQPCKFSHDILDLARLPPDDHLVLMHSTDIRAALGQDREEQILVSPAPADTPETQPLRPDTAKKREKKRPKPGTDAASRSDGPDTAAAEHKTTTEPAVLTASLGPAASGSGGVRVGRQQRAVAMSKAGAVREPGGCEDPDGDSTDQTFYSVDSQIESAEMSPVTAHRSARNPRSQLPCYAHIHGRCNWQNCRFSHDVDTERSRRDFLEASSSTRNQPLPTHAPLQITSPEGQTPAQQRKGEGRRASRTGHQPPVIGAMVREAPIVPPGLGLETMVQGSPTSQHRAAPEFHTITVLDSTKVTFGPGFVISNIVTGFECRQIVLEDLPGNVDPADLKVKLEAFGAVTSVVAMGSSPRNRLVTFRITFSSGDAAAEAASTLDGSRLFGRTVFARLAEKTATLVGGGTLQDGDVLFELPTPWQTGFVGYPTEELALKAIALAQGTTLGYMEILAEQYKGIPMVGTYNVRFRGIPPHFTIDDIKKHFGDRLDEKHAQGQSSGRKRSGRRKGKGKEKDSAGSSDKPEPEQPAQETCEGVMLQRAKYTSLQGAIHGLRRMLEEYDEDVSINVLPPPYRKYVRVWAHFTDPNAAAKACTALHRFCPRFVNKERIYAYHIKSLLYNLPPSIFDVLAYDIDLLRSYMQDDEGTSISVIDRRQATGPPGPVSVKLVSHSMSALTKAKASFERLLRGEKVTDNGQIVWNDFFGSKAGHNFLCELEKTYPKVKITSDPLRRFLALFGIQGQRERVREEILDQVKRLRSQTIRRYPVAGLLMTVFMSENLVALQKELGFVNVWFDLTNQQLVVRGDEDAQAAAELALKHAKQHAPRRAESKEVCCPVCFGEVSQPVTLGCGHTWCKDCIVGYLVASVDNKSFPLACLADEARCAQPIAFSIAQRLLSTEQFDAVVLAAFTAHVQQRPAEFHYCPTPDCPQVYRQTATAIAKGKGKAAGKGRPPVLQCPACLVRICPHCNTEYHETASCQDSSPEDIALFERWKTGHDVKNCPGCRVPIERAAGCNHMTCVSCKIHICWACLETFAQSGDVYAHMRAIHGGIGL